MPEELKKTPNPTKPDQPKQLKRIEAKEGAIKKKPFWKRVKETFFAETAKNVGNYLWKDVMLPALKKLIADSSMNAINMAIYGEQRPINRVNGANSQSSVYAGRSMINRQVYNRSNRYQSIMENCPPCEKSLLIDIMDEIQDMIATYGHISVEDLSQILPVELSFQTVHTDRNWGWTNLNYNCIVSVPGGWILDLPPARSLQ